MLRPLLIVLGDASFEVWLSEDAQCPSAIEISRLVHATVLGEASRCIDCELQLLLNAIS